MEKMFMNSGNQNRFFDEVEELKKNLDDNNLDVR